MKNIGLQYLRAISCMGILVAHSFAYAEMNFEGMVVADMLDYFGRYGMLQYVAFFFMITGYFTARQIREGNCTVKEYYVKRLKSIYPTYWSIAAFCIFINLSFFHNFETTEEFLNHYFF
ncbi:acyltransferase family protein [Butyrivibrio sp. WCD3002]|uniref:acyltransferase family protein n=1 Tax=Butyrivibrio sp. WCD3002 TaxID=1280676 RepID=UPI000478B455|nr:acyltransferase family protein [Butyrivibrio sp. WCD3002]